jgi:hypothetical protein
VIYFLLVDQNVLVERPFVLDNTADKGADDLAVCDEEWSLAFAIEVVEYLNIGIADKARRVRERELLPPADVNVRVRQAELANEIVNRVFLGDTLAFDFSSAGCAMEYSILMPHNARGAGSPKIGWNDAFNAGNLRSRLKDKALSIECCM